MGQGASPAHLWDQPPVRQISTGRQGDVGNTWAAQNLPFRLSCLSCLLGEFRRWELDKKVPSFADQGLIRKVLWDLGQEVVDRGHVTLAVQNFLFPMQHNLQRSERRTDKEVGKTPWHMLVLVSEPEKNPKHLTSS